MAVTTAPASESTFRTWIRQPRIMTGLIVGYIALAVLILVTLNRGDLLFPIWSSLAFPPFILSPFVILAAPIPGRTKVTLLLLLIILVMPLIGIYDGGYLELSIQIAIYAALALGLNIVVGFAGLLDLGYVAFFAVGAYLWAMFSSTNGQTIFVEGFNLSTSTVINFAAVGIGVLAILVLSALRSRLPALRQRRTFLVGMLLIFAVLIVGAYIGSRSGVDNPAAVVVGQLTVPAIGFYVFIIIGIVVAALVGILLGLPVLRLRGDYLAIVTLGFGEMIRVLARNLDQPVNFTNGSQGLAGVLRPPLPGPLTDFVRGTSETLSINVPNPEPVAQQLLFYFLAIGILAVCVLVARRLDDSPIGRAWTAIREDEVAAIAMGVPLVRMKLLAFASGAAFAGAIGVLYAAKQTFVSPESFSLIQSISILAMVIVGGLGGIRGVILGAMIVTLLNLQILTNFSLQVNALRNIDYVVPIINFHIRDWPAQLEPAKYQRLVFGFLLIVMMIFRPAGLLPEPRRKQELRAHRAEPEEIARLEEPVIASEVDPAHRNEG
jgi:branched-chain amino acid transport system permease protein